MGRGRGGARPKDSAQRQDVICQGSPACQPLPGGGTLPTKTCPGLLPQKPHLLAREEGLARGDFPWHIHARERVHPNCPLKEGECREQRGWEP